MTFAATPARVRRAFSSVHASTPSRRAVGTRRVTFSAAAASSGRGGRSGRSGRGRGRGTDGRDVIPRQRRHFDDDQLERLARARERVEAGTFASASVARGKANMFLDGNPIVYAGALERVRGANGRGTCERGIGCA